MKGKPPPQFPGQEKFIVTYNSLQASCPPENTQDAFRGCNDLKLLQLDEFDGTGLAGLLPHLCLPALMDLTLPPLMDAPPTFWDSSPRIGIIVDSIKRHLETLRTFQTSCTGSETD